MSGGHFDYSQHRIGDIARSIEELIESNNDKSKDEYGQQIGNEFKTETINKFKEAVIYLRKSAIMAQRIDWLVSGDDGEDTFHERWDDELSELGSGS